VLGRLAEESSPDARRTLFHALDPVWRTIADDYPAVLAAHPRPWPVAVNALALGLEPSSVEPSLVAPLEAWRSAAADQPEIEPWDWWWRAGTTARALRDVLPLSRLLPINSAYHESLGAPLDELRIAYAWVSERLLRFGCSRSAADVLRDVLGRPPSPDALLAALDF
jgi:hypothetical protein